MFVFESYFCIVRHISSQNSAHLVQSVLGVLIRAKSKRAANSCARPYNISGLLVIRKTASTSDAEIGTPDTIQVQLLQLILVHILNTVMEGEFFVKFRSL